MTPAPEKRTRILALWGASAFDDGYFADFFGQNPAYEIEIVSGDRSKKKSPYAASWGRLLDLRRRLERGEFDLVLSGPVQNTAWPQNKRLATRLAQAFRYFTYKHRMLDSFWTSWLLGGRARGRVPLAVIDFLDTSYVLPKDFPLLRAATLYFKLNLYYWPRRSLLPLETYYGQRQVLPHLPKLRPFSHGIPPRWIAPAARPMRERDIDLCFTASFVQQRSPDDPSHFEEYTSNPIRREIFERCQKLKKQFNVYCSDQVIPREEGYTELLQRSKLVVCTESYGCETYRHYDVAAAGAVPLVNWPYAQNYRQFQPDVHAVYFSLIGDDFERTVARALADPAKLAEIAENARALTVGHKQRHQIGAWIVEETLREHAARSAPVADL